jgi:hypothetical protein
MRNLLDLYMFTSIVQYRILASNIIKILRKPARIYLVKVIIYCSNLDFKVLIKDIKRYKKNIYDF